MKLQAMNRLPWVSVLAWIAFGCGEPADSKEVAAGGTGGESAGSCEVVPMPYGLASCAMPKGAISQPPVVNVLLSGPVLAIGDVVGPIGNIDPTTCFGLYAGQDAFWFEAADANGDVWSAGAFFKGLEPPIVPGDIIEADIEYQFGGWGGSISILSLHDSNGKLLLYIGDGRNLSDLNLPEGITATLGKTFCSHSDNCGDTSLCDLDVTLEGTTKTVAYGAIETIGPYRVAHGGCEITTFSMGMCHMWYVGRVVLGVVPVL